MEPNQFSDDQKTTIATLAAKGVIALAEFRGEKPEIVEYIDKTSGKKRFISKHNIALEYLGTGEQVPAELYTARGEEPQYDKDGRQTTDQPRPEPPPLTGLARGTLLIVQIGSFFKKQGKLTCRIESIIRLDTLQPLDVIPTEAPESAKEYNLKDRRSSKA